MLNRKWKTRAISFLFVCAAGFVLYKVGRSLLFVPSVIHNNKPSNISENNEFSEVVYTSFDKDSNNFTLKSSKVRENNEKSLDFSEMITTFQISPDETATVYADKTYLISQEPNKRCHMKGNVRLSTESGLFLETEESFIDIDNKIASGNTDVLISQDDGTFSARKYHFDMDKKIVTLIKDVKGKLEDDLISADKLVIEFEKSIGKDLKKVHAFGNSSYKTDQYNIKANKEIIYQKECAEATGQVDLDFEQNEQQYHVNTEHLTIDFQDNIIKKVIADTDVVITIDDLTTIKGDHGILEHDLLTISGNTVITNKDSKILCKKAMLNTKTNDIKIYNSKGIIKRN